MVGGHGIIAMRRLQRRKPCVSVKNTAAVEDMSFARGVPCFLGYER